MKKKKNKQSFFKKLTYHYRFLVINDDTYEEKFSFKLNRLNVFVWTSLFALILIVGTSLLIAFTPLRTYIPGYTAPGLRKQALELKIKMDSLKQATAVKNYYINELRKVLKNEITIDSFERAYTQNKINPDTLNLKPGKADSLLRIEVAEREKFKVNTIKNKLAYNFIAPLKGVLVNAFNPAKKHYGVDITVAKKTPVRSIADGRVVFSGYTTETGYTIIIKHQNDVISVYKHNSKLLRKEGEFVKQGEAIAQSGNTGEKTTGPHLHLELWIKDYAVNPEDFINFQQ